MRVAVLVTCHNRINVTLRGLTSLVDALDRSARTIYDLFIIDDGSSDETATILTNRFPNAYVEIGDGSLFWNGGMCRAYDIARRKGNFDAYLLFNDDVVVHEDSLVSFFSEYNELNSKSESILVAATIATDGSVSYSAYTRLSKARPLKLKRIGIANYVQPCDTFNGNFVLIPAPFFERVGGLDPFYTHAYGDIDLGYVAKNEGVSAYLASVPIGVCMPNSFNRKNVRVVDHCLHLLCGFWTKQDTLRQRLYFLRKHGSMILNLVIIPTVIVRYGIFRLLRRFVPIQ